MSYIGWQWHYLQMISDEKYNENFIDMFSTDGWKQLQAEYKELLDALVNGAAHGS